MWTAPKWTEYAMNSRSGWICFCEVRELPPALRRNWKSQMTVRWMKSPGDRTNVHQNSPDLNFKEFQLEGSTTRITWPRESCMAVRSGVVDASLVEGFTWHFMVYTQGYLLIWLHEHGHDFLWPQPERNPIYQLSWDQTFRFGQEFSKTYITSDSISTT